MLGLRWAKVFAAFIALFALSCSHGESAPEIEVAPKTARQASTTTGFTWDGVSKDTFAGPSVAQLFVAPGFGMHLDQIELPQIGGNYPAYVYITKWDTSSNRPADIPENAIYKSPLIPAGAAGSRTLAVDSDFAFHDFESYALVFTMAEAVGPLGFGADQANPATISYGFGDDSDDNTYLSGVKNGGDARIGLDGVVGSDWGSPFGLYFSSDLAYTLTWRRATQSYAEASNESTKYGEPFTVQAGSGFASKGIIYLPDLTETFSIPKLGPSFTKTAVTAVPPKGGFAYATVTYNAIPVTDTGDGDPGVEIMTSFAGNTDYGPSAASTTHFVSYGDADITLDRDSATIGLGTPVTFTATLTPLDPSVVTPAGQVHFADVVGQTVVQSADVVIDATGKAVWKPSFGSLGSHLVTADYMPVKKTYNETATSTEITVFTIPTTTTLSSTQNPATLGADSKIRATVTSQAGTPTGKVRFVIDGTPVTPDVDLGAGVAEVSTSTLPLGAHIVNANYLGAGTFAASAADRSLTQQIDKDAVAIAVTTESPASPSTYADDVSFVFKVTSVSSGTTPTGTFSVTDGATALATNVALAGGSTPAVKLTAPAAGTHAIKFTYSGDAAHSGASQTINHIVNKVAPALTLTDSGDTKFGQSFTLTAKIAQVGPTPASGTVDFFEGANLLGSAAAPPWTLTRSDLAVGTHAIVAKYSGDSNYLAIADSAHTATHVVGLADTTTQIASATNPSAAGAPVALTIVVAPSAANPVTPTGGVTVFEGAAVKGSGTLDSAGHLTLSLAGLGVGTHTLRAVYAGDASYATSTSPNLVQTVARNTTAITVTSSKSPSAFGESVTFVAHIPSANDKDATGSVTFIDGPNVIGTADVSNAAAFLTTSSLTTGSHVITVSYSGDANFLAGSASTAQIVGQAVTSTVLAIVPGNALFGQATRLTATVTGATTGTVRFREGGVVIGTAAVTGGVATLDKSNWPVGTHSLSATFDGDTNHGASAGTGSLVVSKADTKVTVTSSANPAAAGTPVSFTAVVAALSPGAGAPTGATVTFRDGQTVLGTAGVGSGGVATFTTSFATGTHAITASVDATASFNASTSAAFVQTVSAAPITVALGASSDQITFGDAATFTVTVSGGASPPAGDVVITEGATTICTIAIANGGGTCAYSAFDAGTHTLTATFSGATSSTSVVVEKAPTTTALTSTPNPSRVGEDVTFTGTVTTGATGDVEVSITGRTIGTIALNGNTVSKVVSGLEAGSYVLTAHYLGDANHLESTSDVLTQVVNAVEVDAGSDASPPPDASSSGGTSSGGTSSSSSSTSSSSSSGAAAPPTADAGGTSGGLGAIPVNAPGDDDDGCSTSGPGTGGSAAFGIALAFAGLAMRRRRAHRANTR